ncbi:putative G3BP-like protein [Fusarium oxysporum f. sp. albedinis]|nr:putative G3BP-like protein [Fusarium oxysporum f. sp. albedinis]
MSSDRLLRTVLQHYPDVHDAAKTEQIIGSTTHLLTELTNPLNLGLLTSQLLTAPAIWFQPGGIRTSVRVISIYNTAAARIHNYEVANRDRKEPHEGGGLGCEEWTRAVVKGADDRSRRWQHLLVLTGVLMGMESSNRQSLSRGMRNTLGEAVVMAANLALESRDEDGPVAGASVVMALNFAFPLLSDFHRSLINCNALLPLIVWTVTAEEGFGHGQFLAAVSSEVVESPNHLLAWSPNTPSFRFIQELDRRPTLANMGPLAKLAGYAVQQATDTQAVIAAQDALLAFSSQVLDMWRLNRLSDIDPALEGNVLTQETIASTWPVLWNLLRKLMFGTVAILQAIVSRSLLDPRMLNDMAAPERQQRVPGLQLYISHFDRLDLPERPCLPQLSHHRTYTFIYRSAVQFIPAAYLIPSIQSGLQDCDADCITSLPHRRAGAAAIGDTSRDASSFNFHGVDESAATNSRYRRTSCDGRDSGGASFSAEFTCFSSS